MLFIYKLLATSLMTFASNVNVITAPTEHLFVPKGFDSNDSVQVIVTGTFPNTCYSRNTSEVTVEDKVIHIRVNSIEQQSKNVCALMLVPFKEEVNLGLLPSGVYEVVVNAGTKNEVKGSLEVVSSQTSLIDDYIYLDVLYIEQNETDKNLFKIKGMRYSDCLELDRVDTISNGKDTISVLPIMKKVSDFCPMKGQPLTTETEINLNQLSSESVLLHVRTLDGKSVNTIVKK